MSSERDFGTELNRGAVSVRWLPVRIPDAGMQARFACEKAFDLVIFSPGGVAHGVELKQVKKGLSWPIRALAPHQERNLLEVERLGSLGWVIVNFRVRLSEREQKRRNQRILNATFAARVGQVVQARAQEAYTSLSLDWWIANGVELSRLSLQGDNGERLDAWDPRPLLGHSSDKCALPTPLPPPSPPAPPDEEPCLFAPDATTTPPARQRQVPRTSTRLSRTDRALNLWRPLDQGRETA